MYIVFITIGFLNLYSSDYISQQNGTSFFKTTYGMQFIWISASLIIVFVLMLIDTVAYSMLAYIIYAAIIGILFLVLILGDITNGAKSWFEIGSFKIQPTEFAKFATSLALARFVSMNELNFKLNNLLNTIVTFGIVFIPILLILLQPDVGSALVYFAFIFVLYREGLPAIWLWLIFISIIVFILALTMNPILLILISISVVLLFILFSLDNKKHIFRIIISLASIFSVSYFLNLLFYLKLSLVVVIIFSLLIWTFYILYYFSKIRIVNFFVLLLFLWTAIIVQFSTDMAFHKILKPHQKNRIEVLFDESIDPQGVGYNLKQSKIAIGSGGLSGKGYLKGTQTKLNFVPEHNTDFIFCTLAEEWGFVGIVIVFILYGFFIIRIFYKAEQQISDFSRIYGYSVGSIFFLHFFVNIGMTIGLIPVIGIPLPFFSYGGSSMLGFSILLFIFIKLDTEKHLKI